MRIFYAVTNEKVASYRCDDKMRFRVTYFGLLQRKHQLSCVQIDDKQLHKNNLLLFSLCLFLRSLVFFHFYLHRVDDDKNWFTFNEYVPRKENGIVMGLSPNVNRRIRFQSKTKIPRYLVIKSSLKQGSMQNEYDEIRANASAKNGVDRNNTNTKPIEKRHFIQCSSWVWWLWFSCIDLYVVTPSLCLYIDLCVHIKCLHDDRPRKTKTLFASRYAPGEWI